VCVIATELIVADTVFVPAAVERRVPAICPLASVVPTGCVSVLPPVGVAASVTVAPWIGLPLASFAVTVMVDVPLPAAIGSVTVTVLWHVALAAAIGDVAVPVDCVAERAPVVTTTVALCVTATASTVAVTVLDSATVALKVPVATPLAFVVALGCVRVLPLPV